MDPASGTVAASPTSWIAAKIEVPERSLPTNRIVLSGTGARCPVKATSLKTEIALPPVVNSFAFRAFSGSTQANRGVKPLKENGNITDHWSGPKLITVKPVVELSNVNDRLVDEFSVMLMRCPKGWANAG